MRLSVPTRRSGTRQPRSVYVFRFVPGTSPLHRLWAGTKLLCVLAIVVTMTLVPSWSSIVLFASLVLIAARVAQVPRTVVPRLPVWFWGSLLIGSLLALAAGHPPTLALGAAPCRLRIARYVLAGDHLWPRPPRVIGGGGLDDSTGRSCSGGEPDWSPVAQATGSG